MMTQSYGILSGWQMEPFCEATYDLLNDGEQKMDKSDIVDSK